jgi:superfamily II DNA or RNA helicase
VIQVSLTVNPAWATLSAPPSIIEEVDNFFSYTNKSAQYELARFLRTEKFRRSRMENKPDWYDDWYKKKVNEIKESISVRCCRKNQSSIDIPIGLLDRAVEMLSGKCQVSIKDNRDLEPNRKHLGEKGEKKKLRKPQEEALKALEGKTSGLLKIATGVGKTVLGEELIAKLGCRAIFLVPSTPILNQTVRRFKLRFGDRMVGEYSGKKKQENSWITVATYQSVYASEKGTFDDISLVIADEVHHVAAETFFGAVVEKIPNAVYRFGLTADEERADGGTILVHSAVGDIAYQYTASQAIEAGYLARPTYFIYSVYRTQGSFKKWKIKNNKRVECGVERSQATNDSDEGKCYKNWVLGNDLLTAKVASMARAFVEDGMSVLVLIDEKEHADKFAQHLEGIEYGVCVGGGKENENYLKSFNQRKMKLLIGTSTLGEGTDLIPVDVMFQMQGGASRSRTRQADGRALRNDPDPETGIPRKPTSLIIDFNFPMCDTLARHSNSRREVHAETGEVIDERLNL